MNPLPPDPYIALGVEKDADVTAIKSAYRKLVLKCHPDKVQDPALKAIKQNEFQRVQQAYEILSDENKRREYDDEIKLKKLREEVMKNMPHHSASRPPPKNYYEFNVRTAEPPPSFRPGPPPRSPYATGSPHFTSSWDRDIPTRSKQHIYEEDVEQRKARRAASYEKPRKEEETKEERRRRKEGEEERRRADREKDKERERRRESEKRDRQKEAERDARKAEERELRKAEERKAEERRIKKELEKREKERDRQRRQEQEDKMRQKKAPFIEHHDSSDEDVHRVHKKKSSSSTKKHSSDSPRRDKSSRREASPALEPSTVEKTHSAIAFAAEYMHQARRKGSKSGPSTGGYPDAFSPTPNFPNPEEAWHGDAGAPRSRRGSHEDKKFQVTVEEEDDEPEVIEISAEGGRPPRLQKSFTSPLDGMHMANSSVPRTPKLARAATMDYSRATPPQAPPAPSPEARHSSKSDRRRRGSTDAYDEEPRPRRSGHHRYDDGTRVLQPEYRPVEEIYSYSSSRGASFRKVRVAPEYNNVTQAQGYDEYKVTYSDVPYSSSPHGGYHQQYAQYVSG